MEFKEIQKNVEKVARCYGEKYNMEMNKDFLLVKLFEEVGELAQAHLVYNKRSRPEKYVSEDHSKEKVAEELADVLGMVILNAKILDIDLEEALNKKWSMERYGYEKKEN